MAILDLEPILFVGVPRSGTTIIFEQYALHPDLAWVINYARIMPRLPAVSVLRRLVDNELINLRGSKNQFGDLGPLNKFLPRPDEAYEFWTAHSRADFARDYLLGVTATKEQRARLTRVMESTRVWQGRPRITAKLTGPGRIGYLSSVWPQARFVSVVRDGLAVVKSLLNVAFWRHQGGLDRPWWSGGLTDADLEHWENNDRDAGVLAALQWRRIVETTRNEAAALGDGQFTEVRYEAFAANPTGTVSDLYRRTGLDASRDPAINLVPRNQRYGDDWDDAYRARLVECMQPVYSELGYGSTTASWAHRA